MKEITLKALDNKNLSIALFEPAGEIKAVIQVIHGMQEHKERYFEFAKYLADNGYVVITKDMRGHGKNENELGFFALKNGYKTLINDETIVYNHFKEIYKDKPFILLGHSMGSIIARNVLISSSNRYSKVVLSGYPNYQGAVKIALLLSNCMKAFGKKKQSKLLQNLTVGPFNKAVQNPKTPVDWLSYNEENVLKYIDDPLCGFNFTTSAYNDLYHLIINMHKAKKYTNVNKNLKFLLLSGADDPCVGKDKGRLDSKNVLDKAGFNHIEVITYEKMRHEILNETNKQQVYDDILNFLDK